MTTFWISFEDRLTEAWVGTLIIDREDFDLKEVAIRELLAELGAEGLAPIGQFTVDVQPLPAIMSIPASYKNRLIN